MSDDHKHDKGQECPHCAALASGMTQEEALEHGMQMLEKMVREQGFAVCGVDADEENEVPQYFYTIGLARLGMPEIIVFCLPQQSAMMALHMHITALSEGKKLQQAAPHILQHDMFRLPMHVIEVDKLAAPAFATDTFAYYEREGKGVEPEFVQWVLTDKNGKAPWEEGFTPHFFQPVLLMPNEDGTLPDPYKAAAEAAKPTLH